MNKTQQILETLRSELRSGRYKTGTKFPSEQQLMMRFDAARTTINKITAQLASDGFIERGIQGAGTRVRDSSPFPVGSLAYFGNVNHPYYARMIYGIQRAAFMKGYAVSFFDPSPELFFSYLEKIRHSRYQGILAANIGIIPDPFPIPVVYLDNAYKLEASVRASVSCTNYQGAVDMAEEVIAHGHKEILIVSSLISIENSREERIQGFLNVLRKHHIPMVEKRVFHLAQKSYAAARFLLRKALGKFPESTVIICDSDNVALLLHQAIQNMQLPKPITLTGFGNLSGIGGFLLLPGVEQHPEEIGTQGVYELLRMINDPEYISSGRIEIETELVNLDKLPNLYH